MITERDEALIAEYEACIDQLRERRTSASRNGLSAVREDVDVAFCDGKADACAWLLGMHSESPIRHVHRPISCAEIEAETNAARSLVLCCGKERDWAYASGVLKELTSPVALGRRLA
jgi:hypothetical protein